MIANAIKKHCKIKKINYKTLQNDIQTNFVVRYLDYNHKKIQINTETFTMLSTREKERKKPTMVETLVLHS